MPTKPQGQRKASLAGGSCGGSWLGGTTRLLTGGMLLEQPSPGPDYTSPPQCKDNKGSTSYPFLWWLGTCVTQTVSPQEKSTFSIFFSFARFECTRLNETLGRRQLLGYLSRRLQRVGGDDRHPEPPTPSLDQEWDGDENTMAK